MVPPRRLEILNLGKRASSRASYARTKKTKSLRVSLCTFALRASMHFTLYFPCACVLMHFCACLYAFHSVLALCVPLCIALSTFLAHASMLSLCVPPLPEEPFTMPSGKMSKDAISQPLPGAQERCRVAHKVPRLSRKVSPRATRSTTSSPFRQLANVAPAKQIHTQMQICVPSPKCRKLSPRIMRATSVAPATRTLKHA